MLDKSEIEQLDRSWNIIRIIWGALVGSLVVSVAICNLVEANVQPPTEDFPFETLKNVLFGVSLLMFLIIYHVRKALLKVSDGDVASFGVRQSSMPVQSPAAGKYLTAIIVATALAESIGVYGLVLFFLSRDMATLYQFIIMSAISMFIYRPRKEELLALAGDLRQQRSGSRGERSEIRQDETKTARHP